MVDSNRITRRQLLTTTAGAAGFIALGNYRAIAAEEVCGPCPTTTVYHLETTWPTPRGPYGKTRLVSRASRRAAQHRYALSAADAIDMNLHLCSYAPAGPTPVCAVEFASLWEELSYVWHNPWLGRDVRIFDIRHVAGIPNGEARLAHALLESTTGADHCTATEVDGVDELPFTGASTSGVFALGAGMIMAGLLSLRMSRMRPDRAREIALPPTSS